MSSVSLNVGDYGDQQNMVKHVQRSWGDALLITALVIQGKRKIASNRNMHLLGQNKALILLILKSSSGRGKKTRLQISLHYAERASIADVWFPAVGFSLLIFSKFSRSRAYVTLPFFTQSPSGSQVDSVALIEYTCLKQTYK